MFARLPALIGLALTAGIACASPVPPPAGAAAPRQTPGQALAGYEAYFALIWNGARIGGAAESLRPRDQGLRFERRERVSMRRGDAVVHSELVIAITTDMDLRARDIAVWQITGDTVIQGRARRDQHGQWRASHGDEPERVLSGDAVPAELVPLMLAANQQAGARPDAKHLFRGPVILAGHGFAVATLEVELVDERTRLATLRTRHGLLSSRLFLTRYGTLARVMGEHGTAAVRVAADDLAVPFEPPEIVDSVSLPVTRAGASAQSDPEAADAPVLLIEPVHRAAPPPLPGQQVAVGGRAWRVRLGAGDTGTLPAEPAEVSAAASDPNDRELAELAATLVRRARAADARAEVVALVRGTAELLDDDLGAPVTSARAALAFGRGDCTAHALLFAGLARARGIPVRLVTGYRLDHDRLVRHRWAMVAVGGAWIAVDPTHGEAPARPRLLGLAVHDATVADMAMADELAFAGVGAARVLATY